MGLFAESHHGHDFPHNCAKYHHRDRNPEKRPICQYNGQCTQGEGQGNNDNSRPRRRGGAVIGMDSLAGVLM